MSDAPPPSPLWRRLTRLGVAPRAAPLESRHVVVVNTLTLVAIAADTMMAPFDLTRNFSLPMIGLHAAVLSIYATILALNQRGRATAASLIFMCTVVLGTVAGVIISGPESGVHFGFIAEIWAAFLIFHHRKRWLAILFAAVVGALYVGANAAALRVEHAAVMADAAMFRSTSSQIVLVVFVIGYLARRISTATQAEIRAEREAYAQLLHDLFPAVVAESLLRGEKIAPRVHERVSVVCCDIVGFTGLAEERAPEDTVQILDELFSRFDRLCVELDIEKIKTVGDGYVAAAGLWSGAPSAPQLLTLARGMLKATREIGKGRALGLDIRVGVSTGSVFSGVVGTRKATFDLWGDAVERAHLMERNASPGTILLDTTTAALARNVDSTPTAFRDEQLRTINAFAVTP
ncbi:MAG: hypothetical protein H6713_04105 [Myxococcales bacterium]|nr:hypothetical protein [Myxococcales bacterium]MCB9749174.1 hypothetical protein [Myxococcales bacterium]